MNLPARILDLHTHLFNARYVPLANVIADRMKRDEDERDRNERSRATRVARLLEELTGSSYEKSSYKEFSYKDLLPPAVAQPLDKDALDEALLKSIWAITRQIVLSMIGSPNLTDKGGSDIGSKLLTDPIFESLRSSELMKVITELSNVDLTAEGWSRTLPQNYVPLVPYESLAQPLQLRDFLKWFENTEKTTLWVLKELMDPNAWWKTNNYLEFFLTMLMPEQVIVEKIFTAYGDGLPPLQISHYMMDMEMAWKIKIKNSPRYPFYPTQIDYMQKLQKDNSSRVIGFSAFDPRRGKDKEEWEKIAEESLARGFVGFKFYPAMGYKPIGNKEPIQGRIDDLH
jgi:hypothetical protein